MTLEVIRDMLAWCSVINLGILIFWALFYAAARGVVFKCHGGIFDLTQEQINKTHYKGIILYKIGIILFNIAPYLALRIVG